MTKQKYTFLIHQSAGRSYRAHEYRTGRNRWHAPLMPNFTKLKVIPPQDFYRVGIRIKKGCSLR